MLIANQIAMKVASIEARPALISDKSKPITGSLFERAPHQWRINQHAGRFVFPGRQVGAWGSVWDRLAKNLTSGKSLDKNLRDAT
ncbi:MAG: hypothetical protein WAM70_03345 [Pyrinomonadaceae bacterium]